MKSVGFERPQGGSWNIFGFSKGRQYPAAHTYSSKFQGYKVPGFLEYSIGDVFKDAYNGLAKSYLRGLGK